MGHSGLEKLNELSKGDYQAFLYDCDGTLADNMALHTQSYLAAAAEEGLDFDPAIIDELAGWPTVKVVEEINRRYDAALIREDFSRRKVEIYRERYLPEIKAMDYVAEHLKANAGRVRIGVVSGGDRTTISKTLEILGLSELVEVLVCSGDTEKGKPFPDPFLKAAALLGVPPGKCLVFEDGQPGVEAARAANMHWIRIDQFTSG